MFAEFVIECAAVALALSLKEQLILREDARRSNWLFGGGVQGVVLFHDPDAIR